MRPPRDLPPVDFLLIWQPYSRSDQHPWWWHFVATRLLRPGFAHVTLIMPDPIAAVWTIVEPLFGGVQIRNVPLTVTCADLLAEYPGTTFAVLHGRRRDLFPRRTRIGLTCVTVVAAILGLETSPLTPWRLYRHVSRLAKAEQDGWRGRADGQAAGTGPAAEAA